MSNIKISVIDHNDPLVQYAKDLVQDIAVASWAILFGGERWLHVKRVAIAQEFGGGSSTIVGIASLSPHGEFDDSSEPPSIIGVWVHPNQRRQGIGAQLVKALAEESRRLYGQSPRITGATKAGFALVRAAERDGMGIVEPTLR